MKKETPKPVYETDDAILSFAGSGNLCFCDDYPFEIEVDGIIYPCVKNAVLSHKTTSIVIKKQIAETKRPADLQALEERIPAPQSWNQTLILSLYQKYTLQKFENNELFAQKLRVTEPKNLIDGLMEHQGRYDFKELRHLENYQGILLMDIRRYQKTKTFTVL